MLDKIQELFSLNIVYILGGIFVIIEIFKCCLSSIEWIAQKFGIEFKWKRKKEEDHKLLIETVQGLNTLKEHHEDDVRKSIKHDEKIESNLNIMSQSITKMVDKLEILEKRSVAAETASRESLADKINEKYKYYISINGIPEDEVDEFDHLHTAYKGVGGNHSGDAKFDYCMKNLPIIPCKVNLVFGNKNENRAE